MPPELLDKLVSRLSRLPGIGPKSAQRLAYHILSTPEGDVRELAETIWKARKHIHGCSVCGAFTDAELCPVCADDNRDRTVICVVRDARDVAALERMRDYRGLYHVLGGLISPMEGRGPDDIRIPELIARLDGVHEVILATNPDLEGEATASYLAQTLKPKNVRVTRIAHGLPVGGDLEYTDEVTLARAVEWRREL